VLKSGEMRRSDGDGRLEGAAEKPASRGTEGGGREPIGRGRASRARNIGWRNAISWNVVLYPLLHVNKKVNVLH